MSETEAEFVEIMMEQGDWGPGSRMHRLALLARRGAEAAEIERLRAEVERLASELADACTDLNSARQDNSSFTTEFKRLTAEVERLTSENQRLRAALEWIDQQRYTGRRTINPANGYDRAVALNEKLISVMDAARAALTQEKPND